MLCLSVPFIIFNFGSFYFRLPVSRLLTLCRPSSLKPAEFTELTKMIFFAPDVPENKGTLRQAILMNLLCLMNSSGNNSYLSVSSMPSHVRRQSLLRFALCSTPFTIHDLRFSRYRPLLSALCAMPFSAFLRCSSTYVAFHVPIRRHGPETFNDGRQFFNDKVNLFIGIVNTETEPH